MRPINSKSTRITLYGMAAISAAVAATCPTFAAVSVVPGGDVNSVRPVGQTIPTMSIAGSTAIKNWIIGNAVTGGSGFTLLPNAPGNNSITLGSGVGGQSKITYTNNNANIASYQIANPVLGNDTPVDGTAAAVNQSALRLEYHEDGSVEGTLDLANDEIATGLVIPDNTNYNPSLGNATYANGKLNTFGGSSAPGNGLIPTPPNGTVTSNGYSFQYQTAGARNPNAQSLVQVGVSDVNPHQAFSYGGSATGTVNSTPTSNGYGKGNPFLVTTNVVGNPSNLGVAGGRQQLRDQSLLNMANGAANPNFDATNPNTGPANYGVGAWNTAGINNLTSVTAVVTATAYVANPGTGLTHINRTDAQFLDTTASLQNGATFNMSTRDTGSGTRNVAANNIGIDPSYAVGLNDNGNGNAADGGGAQIRIGSGLTFSNKTSGGSQLRPVVQINRMAVGTLGIPDTTNGGTSKNSSTTPIRALAYRDDANDISDNSNGNAWVNYNEDGAGNSTHTNGDLPSGTFILPSFQTISDGAYVINQNETFVAVKVPTAALYQASNALTSTTAIKGDDAGNSVQHVLNMVNTSAAQITNTTQSPANPADAALIAGFIPPSLTLVSKTQDGLQQFSANSAYGAAQQAYRQNFISNAANLTSFNPADPSTVTSGTSAFYGNKPSGEVDAIPITSQNYFFGNFNQNGTRDLSAVLASQPAQAALFANNAGATGTSMFAGASNSTAISGLAGPLANMNGVGVPATKGDLITMGDYNGDGVFDGKDIYLMAKGAALSDASGGGLNGYANGKLTTDSGATFADQVRNGVLRKNTALDALNAPGGSTAQQKIDARGGVLYANQAELNGAVIHDYATDPTGANAFNKLDVNHDGKVDRTDAAIVDSMIGKNYRNLNDRLSAVVATSVANPNGYTTLGNGSLATGNPFGSAFPGDPTAAANAGIARMPFVLTNAKLADATSNTDAQTTILRSDFNIIAHSLINSGNLIPGDVNLDGTVDANDLNIILGNFGQFTDPSVSQWTSGDVNGINGDGTVDANDINEVLNNFGQFANAVAAFNADHLAADGIALVGNHFVVVPEPASLGLLAFSGLLLARRRRGC